MNLHHLLMARAEENRPVRVGLIGAGKFGSMFLAQARTTTGIHILGVAELDPDKALQAFIVTGWPDDQVRANSFASALERGTTMITDDADLLIAADGLDVVVDASGDPAAGIRHHAACCKNGRHLVMVNVEADALAGPLLAKQAKESGIVYSMAYGDQPALICEQVDWARACGFDVVAAGKGTRYLPEFHASTPDTVWDHYAARFTAEYAEAWGMNPKMFNSFIDGTKSGIEMTAVANATGLTPAPDGLTFPPCPVEELASTLIPTADGGCLHHKGQVEVIAGEDRDGRVLDNNLRWGVYVTFEAANDFVERCFSDYGLITDESGRYTALWRPYHLIGLELGISVAHAALMGQPTGTAKSFNADVVATAKRHLKAGETLDGEGGYRVWGRLMPAADSLAADALPIGLAHGVTLNRDIAEGGTVAWADVDIDETAGAAAFRREMERTFAP